MSQLPTLGLRQRIRDRLTRGRSQVRSRCRRRPPGDADLVGGDAAFEEVGQLLDILPQLRAI